MDAAMRTIDKVFKLTKKQLIEEFKKNGLTAVQQKKYLPQFTARRMKRSLPKSARITRKTSGQRQEFLRWTRFVNLLRHSESMMYASGLICCTRLGYYTVRS